MEPSFFWLPQIERKSSRSLCFAALLIEARVRDIERLRPARARLDFRNTRKGRPDREVTER